MITLFVRKNSASGTVIDEKPYPSAPFTMAAVNVMTTRATDTRTAISPP